MYFNLASVPARQNAIRQNKKHQLKPINLADGNQQTELEIPTCTKPCSLVSTWLTDHLLKSIHIHVTNENSNRYRVSTNFALLKVFVFVGFFSIVFNLIRDFRNDTFNTKSITGLTLGTIALAGIYYYVSTRKRIDYDDIKQTLYIVDTKTQAEIEVPVESIDKIYLSAFGGRGNSSYVIVYRDFHNQQQNVRLFPILFDNSIKTIKKDTELKNPNVVIRNWTFGWNELFK